MLRLVCGACGATYNPLGNLGAWECTGVAVYSHARARWIPVRGDHDGPYTPASDYTVPSYVMPWLVNVRQDAVHARAPVDAESEYRAFVVHENVTIRRIDPVGYARARDHMYIPPQPPEVLFRPRW